MAPVYKNTSTTVSLPMEAGISALTSSGESLFMCSSKEGHTCYHACRGHGSYPLWSDDTFMVDDIDEEEEEEEKATAVKREDSSSEYDGYSDEEWLSDGADDRAFWEEIQESIARRRSRPLPRITYAASDLRFLLTDGQSTANTEVGPIVGVITTKPPPEYVWYMVDNENWMRGSLPEKLSEEQDGAYFRYRYHVWDRIPNEDVRDSSDSDDYEDEEEDDRDDGDDFEVVEEDEEDEEEQDSSEEQSWSDLADRQEEQQSSS